MTPNPAASSAPPPPLPIAPVWEDRSRPFVARWWLTVRDLLLHPVLFFNAMRPHGSIVAPLLFAAIGGSVPVVVSALTSLPLLGSASDSWLSGTPACGLVNSAAAPILLGASIALAPLWVALFVCIEAALVHGSLMLFGGARRRFATTLRVVGYTAGATLLLAAAPAVGVPAALAWTCVDVILGLKRAHGITMERAATATLVPLVLMACCTLLPALILGTAGGLGGAAASPG